MQPIEGMAGQSIGIEKPNDGKSSWYESVNRALWQKVYPLRNGLALHPNAVTKARKRMQTFLQVNICIYDKQLGINTFIENLRTESN
ncbi:hypothetical protein YC2023_002467 [Brassica napus]